MNNANFKADQVLRAASCVSHWTERLTEEGGTETFVRRGADPYAVPGSDIRHVKTNAVPSSTCKRATHPALIESDISGCLTGRLPILTTGDPKQQHVDWKLQAYHVFPKHCMPLLFKKGRTGQHSRLACETDPRKCGKSDKMSIDQCVEEHTPAPSRRFQQYHLPSVVLMASCCVFCLFLLRITYECRTRLVGNSTSPRSPRKPPA